MGLISAALGAATGVLSDQWKEYFYCEALPINVLATKGKKRNSGRSSNKGSDNIISSGSVIAVADGQCMLISMDYGKPVWVNKKCSLCLGCLHRCPVNAISYGPTTKRNGQYLYTEAKKDDKDE